MLQVVLGKTIWCNGNLSLIIITLCERRRGLSCKDTQDRCLGASLEVASLQWRAWFKLRFGGGWFYLPFACPSHPHTSKNEHVAFVPRYFKILSLAVLILSHFLPSDNIHGCLSEGCRVAVVAWSLWVCRVWERGPPLCISIIGMNYLCS